MAKSNNVRIAACLAIDTRYDTSYNPVVGDMDTVSRAIAYWQCLVVLFASSMRHNPRAEHILYTNIVNSPNKEWANSRNMLLQMGVHVREISFTYLPSEELSIAYGNAYFKLDVLRDLALDCVAVTVFIDPDCIFVRPCLTEVTFLTEKHGMLLYPLNFVHYRASDNIIVTREDLARLYHLADSEYPSGLPIIFGTEFFASTGSRLQELVQTIERVWPIYSVNVPEIQLGSVRLNLLTNDEVFLSFVLNKHCHEWSKPDGIFRRIYTIGNSVGIGTSDLDLAIWHLPQEKVRGIPQLYNEVCRKKSEFWSISLEEFPSYIASFIGGISTG